MEQMSKEQVDQISERVSIGLLIFVQNTDTDGDGCIMYPDVAECMKAAEQFQLGVKDYVYDKKKAGGDFGG